MADEDPVLSLPDGWTVEGPHFKGADCYLSKDGANPEAPWPGYGWPLGTECWFYVLIGPGAHLHVYRPYQGECGPTLRGGGPVGRPAQAHRGCQITAFLAKLVVWMHSSKH